MFRLAKFRVLPKSFLDLKDDVTLRAPCMFGTASEKKLITKRINQGPYVNTSIMK